MSCNELQITVEDTCKGWTIDCESIHCEHGKVEQCNAQKVTLSSVEGGSYGPKARITFRKDNQPASLVEFQQNFCFLHSGQINIDSISGEVPIYRKEEGSYSKERPGRVWIDNFVERD